MDWILPAVSMVVALLGSLISWLLSDAKSKAQLASVEERAANLVRMAEATAATFKDIEIQQARSEQDRLNIKHLIERLDNVKASKEAVEGFRAEFLNLRTEMDRRFDRVERLLMEHPTSKP